MTNGLPRRCIACGSGFDSSDKERKLCIPCERALERMYGYVTPIVHGQWIHKNTCGSNTAKFHCSVCDNVPRSLCPEDYCPNCGAKMDGDVNGT